ncbi:MAG: hypothetical protein WCC65_09835 [Pseudonocardiaceae bacterium]
MSAADDSAVSLLYVDELVLDRLVNAALTDAAANEVTPSVPPCNGQARIRATSAVS